MKRLRFKLSLRSHCDDGFVARPNLRSLQSDDWDEQVADLQYRDACEYAVGHNIATEAVLTDRQVPHCSNVLDTWDRKWSRVAPANSQDVELSMDSLALLANGAAATAGAR